MCRSPVIAPTAPSACPKLDDLYFVCSTDSCGYAFYHPVDIIIQLIPGWYSPQMQDSECHSGYFFIFNFPNWFSMLRML